MVFNSRLLGCRDLYAIAKSNDNKKVCYITYSHMYTYDTIGSDCNFISNTRNIADYIQDKEVENINIQYILENAIFTPGDIVGSIFIGDIEYYVVKVYAYIHSGTSLSLYQYNDRFDSGLGGFFLVKKSYCDLDFVVNLAKDFIKDLELYLEGNIFDFDIFYAEDQETVIDSITAVIDPSCFSSFLYDLGFVCEDSNILMAYDFLDEVKKTYALEA